MQFPKNPNILTPKNKLASGQSGVANIVLELTLKRRGYGQLSAALHDRSLLSGFQHS
jgi:hypothetical protein